MSTISSVRVTAHEDLVAIEVSGHFGFSLYQQFRAACVPADGLRRYLIDLKDTEYMDSAALGMLLVLRDQAGGDRADIRIVNCNPEVRKILTIAHFDRLFQIA